MKEKKYVTGDFFSSEKYDGILPSGEESYKDSIKNKEERTKPELVVIAEKISKASDNGRKNVLLMIPKHLRDIIYGQIESAGYILYNEFESQDGNDLLVTVSWEHWGMKEIPQDLIPENHE